MHVFCALRFLGGCIATLATQCHRSKRRRRAEEQSRTTPRPRQQPRRGSMDCIVRARAARCSPVQARIAFSDHSSCCSESRNSAWSRPSLARGHNNGSRGHCSFRKMLYSGFARAEEPTQFFMYHGGVAVSSAACTLGVADRAPGIKRGTGRANAVVSCACFRILASRRARRR